MKRIFLIFVLILSVALCFGQRKKRNSESTIKWLSLAAKGGGGISMLLNNDVSNDKNINFEPLNLAYTLGGRFGVTYGDYVGLFFEMMYTSYGQQYSFNKENKAATEYKKDLKLTSMDYLVLLRYTGDYGFYAELGPQFTNVSSLTETNSINRSEFRSTENIKNNYNSSYTSMVLGFGLSLFRGERIAVTLGLRGTYSFSDFVLENNAGTDKYYVLDDGVYDPRRDNLTFSPKEPTNPFTTFVILDVNYYFGFWGDAACGKKRLMLFK